MSEVSQDRLREFVDFNAKFVTFLGMLIDLFEKLSQESKGTNPELYEMVTSAKGLLKPGVIINTLYVDKLAHELGIDLSEIEAESYALDLNDHFNGSKSQIIDSLYEEVRDRNMPHFVDEALDEIEQFLRENE